MQRTPPHKNYKAHDYLPCQLCRRCVPRHLLWKHCTDCKLKPGGACTPKLTENGCKMIAPSIKTAVDEVDVNSLFARMSETKADPGVKETCEDDALIRVFPGAQLDLLGSDVEQRPKDTNILSQKCRTLEQLLNMLNEGTASWQPLDHFIRAPKFDNVLEATQKLQTTSDSPKLACNIGHYISQMALI